MKWVSKSGESRGIHLHHRDGLTGMDLGFTHAPAVIHGGVHVTSIAQKPLPGSQGSDFDKLTFQ